MSVTSNPPPAARLGDGAPPPANGHTGQNGQAGAPEPGRPPEFPARRNSIFPFLVDFGAVLALFGLIIIGPLFSALAGNLVLGAGVVLALTALAGWLREARAEYKQLPD